MTTTPRPSDEVSAAVLDAVVTMPLAEDGSVVRTELEQTAVRRETFANVAWARYQAEHPESAYLANGEQYTAITEGLQLLAAEAVSWLIDHDHLTVVADDRVRLGAKQLSLHTVGATDQKRQPYLPGSNRENDLFHNMRRVVQSRKDLILESIAELGDLREFFPVLEDEDGNIVDGRHRRAVDPAWPASRVKVPHERRLAVATAANRSNAWSKKDWEDMLAHRKHVAGEHKAKRVIARLALLEDHERSDRAIAALTGAGQHTVGKIRAELEDTEQIAQYRSVGGKPRKDGTPAQPRHIGTSMPIAAERIAEMNALFDSGASENDVHLQVGVSKATANKYKNIWKAKRPAAPTAAAPTSALALHRPERVELAPETLATEDHTVHECVPMTITICAVCGNRLQ